MPQIPLTKNMFAEVDEIDYEAVIAVGRWCYAAGYAVHNSVSSDGKRHSLFMHRYIFARVLGHAIPPNMQIDHISGRQAGRAAKLDNRRANLRLATRSDNQASKGDQINSASHKGIRLRKNAYQVRLQYYKTRLNLGSYAEFEIALAVYSYAHKTLWKEFTSEAEHSISLSTALQKKIDQQIAPLLHS